MKKNNYTLLSSFEVLHSSFFLIFLICFMHVIFAEFPKFLTVSILPVVAFFIKIFIFAGVFGSIIDLITERIPSATFKSFFENAKIFWFTYLLLFLFKLTLNYLYANLLSFFHLQSIYIVAHFDTLTLLLFSYLIISKKHFKPHKKSAENRYFPIKEILIIAFLHFFNEIILNNDLLFPINRDILANEILFLYTYIQLLTFIFLSKLILENYSLNENDQTGQKELYLINPGGPGTLMSITSRFDTSSPPIFSVLKAFTPKNYKIKEFTRIPWKNRFFKGGKLVAITCFSSNSAEAYKIAKEFKKRGSKVIMGGPHVTFLPKEALKYCNSVVIGDADGIWGTIIHDYENNSLKKKYLGFQTEESRKTLHKELLNSSPDVIRAFLETTTGCKFKCYFCSIPSIKGVGLKKKPVNEVVELILKINKKYRSLLFLDNNIFSDPDYAIALFKALIPLKVKWVSQSTIDIAKNDEALRLAKESGCSILLFGYEIYSNSKEAARKGKFSYTEEYLKLTKKAKKAGIKIKAHFIFGFDSDTILSAFDIWKFSFLINPFATCLSILTPIPGSQCFYEMLKEDRIINHNWRNYDLQHLTFRHRSIKTPIFFATFTALKFLCILTTCKFGYAMILIVLIETVFFHGKHF